MTKRLQNKVSESKLTLPVVTAYGIAVWLAAGGVQNGWWLQLVAGLAATLLMAELNNANALIRIYSRMVSSSLVVLLCCACFLLPSPGSMLLTALLTAAYLMLFRTYQDKAAAGWTYYAFLTVGLTTLLFPGLALFVPLLWLLMAWQLQSLSWRTWTASVLALATPYWLWLCYATLTADFEPLAAHFTPPADMLATGTARLFPLGRPLPMTVIFLTILSLTGTIHFMRKKSADKIFIRQLFGFFIIMDLCALALLIAMPQHSNFLLPVVIVNASPLTGHFIALTQTKVTNAAFIAIALTALGLTVYNLLTI